MYQKWMLLLIVLCSIFSCQKTDQLEHLVDVKQNSKETTSSENFKGNNDGTQPWHAVLIGNPPIDCEVELPEDKPYFINIGSIVEKRSERIITLQFNINNNYTGPCDNAYDFKWESNISYSDGYGGTVSSFQQSNTYNISVSIPKYITATGSEIADISDWQIDFRVKYLNCGSVPVSFELSQLGGDYYFPSMSNGTLSICNNPCPDTNPCSTTASLILP